MIVNIKDMQKLFLTLSFLISLLVLGSCKPADKKSETFEGEGYLYFKPDESKKVAFWKRVEMQHADVKEILNSSNFKTWLFSQDSKTKALVNSNDPEQAIKLINSFKAKAYYDQAISLAGIESNIPRVIDLLVKSTRYGNMQSSFYLGELYRKGELVEKSRRKAFHYLTKARRSGMDEAKVSLKAMGFMRYDHD